jgi:hypothetical protein
MLTAPEIMAFAAQSASLHVHIARACASVARVANPEQTRSEGRFAGVGVASD